MSKKVNFILFLSFIMLISIAKSQVFDFQLVSFEQGSPAFNAVWYDGGWTEPYPMNYYVVGDNGWIYTLDDYGRGVCYNYQIDSEYNLCGVSGARLGYDNIYVYVVGYKRENSLNGPKWKGAIWKALNPTGVNDWFRVPEANLPQDLPDDASIPFLDVVCPSIYDPNIIWVSCGYGYVMRSTNRGDNWALTPTKPVSSNYAGWFWGICADHGGGVWICSDESTLVARSDFTGENWTVFTPFFEDSLSYRDVARHGFNNPGTYYFAASKGYVVFTTDYGVTWNKYQQVPLQTNAEWLRGVFRFKPSIGPEYFLWSVGTGGIIGCDDPLNPEPDVALLWYSKKYDFNAIDGGCIVNPGIHSYVAVGTNKSILWMMMDDTDPREPKNRNLQDGLYIYDRAGDEGWSVYGNWDPYPGAEDFYKVYICPANDTNNDYLWFETDFGKKIDSVPLNILNFEYDSILSGHPIYYTITTNIEGDEEDIYCVQGVSGFDNLAPRGTIANLNGYYSSDLDAAVLHWDPCPVEAESNFGGYWVCPVIGQDEQINHWAPLLRNYYIESVPAGHTRPFDWGFKVQAMDRTGQRGDWQSEYYFITIPVINQGNTDSPFATAFNQGRHLARFNESKLLHMVYETEGKIIYCTSNDNGENWTEEDIGKGCLPCIAVDHKGYPWIAYCKDADIICKVQRSKNSWKEIVVYDGNETTTWAGAPSIALGTVPDVSPEPPSFAYITYTAYEGDNIPEMPSSPPYSISYSYVKLSILDTINIAHYTVDEGDGENQVGFPAIDVTPADYIHLVWQKEDEIWYTTNSGNIAYDNWQNVQLEEKINISESPENLSEHPFVESYGDNVYVAWKEGEPGEIYRRTKNLPFNYWSDPENISQSPENESDYPVLATSDVVMYQEKIDDENYEIYTWILGDIVNLSETEKSSKYPHIVVEPQPPDPQEPEVLIDAIWTEEITPDTLYEVKFKRYIHQTNPEDMGEYLSVTTGDSIASPYCEHRDGFVHYGQYSLDYANSSLVYNLPYLHPKSNYLLKATVYHALTGRWREKLFSDSILGADIYFNPYTPTSVSILLPKESYADDFKISKEIQKFVGRFAVITDFKIYEVSLPDSGGGGAQSAGSARVLKTTLYQNNPNPFNTMTEISFGLAREGNVSFSIFDASGRMVRRLVNDRMKPGNYNLRWDGKDDMKKNLAQGVYFYRIKTEDYTATKKMTLLK
jgi:hypothetical protein